LRSPDALKFWHFVAGYACFSALYVLTQNFHLGSALVVPVTGVDRAIPFLPKTAFVYATQWILAIAPFVLISDDRTKVVTFGRYLMASLLAAAIFVVAPTTVPRSSLPDTGASADLLRAIYSFDQPLNCFPSLHVCFSFLAAAAFKDKGKLVRAGIWTWAVLVSVSTLTTKQHVLLDAVAGLALGCLCLWLRPQAFPKRQNILSDNFIIDGIRRQR